ncbi:zinc-ribbon domain-containing protein [Methanobrevibacter sp.]
MKECPQCGKSVNDSDKRCSQCGQKLDNNKNLKLIIGILAVVVVLGIVGAFVGGVFNNGETNGVVDHSASQVSTPVNNSTNHINHSSQSSIDENGSSSNDTVYWASTRSDKFHKPSCEWAQKIDENNKIVYDSREEAISDGKRPCYVCNP